MFVRILIDGYNLLNAICSQAESGFYSNSSLLHNWPELAAGAARHSERARDALVEMLQHYQDAGGAPVTVFFDGAGARRKPKNESGGSVEVLFSRAGQTADEMIERAAHRFLAHGEVLVVTDDRAERDIVGGFGGSVASCDNFIRMIGGALAELRDELKTRNRTERNRFNRPR